MQNVYITLTGTNHYYGVDFLKPGMRVKLIKEPDNKFDKEAIAIRLEGLGIIGYIANSVHTVVGECISAGRLYDKIRKAASAKVMYIVPTGVVCKVNPKDLKN